MNRMTSALAAVFLTATATLAMSCSAPFESGCQTDDQCRGGRICVDNQCENPDDINGSANSATQNNASANNTTQNNVVNNISPNNANNVTPNNTNPNNVTPNNADDDLALCTEFCDLLFGSCIEENCELTDQQNRQFQAAVETCIFIGFDGDPGCLDAINEPGAREEVEGTLDRLTCSSDEIRQFQCGELQLGGACGCDSGDTPIGGSCSSTFDCDGGNLQPVCATEMNEPPFPGGYCAAFGCDIDETRPRARYDAACGADDNVCFPIGDGNGGVNGLCLDGCEAHSECRDEYQCRLVGADRASGSFSPIRVCLPECGPNLRCNGDQERCNQGRCEFRCSDQSNGGPTGRQRCEGLGFDCVADDTGVEWCVMP